jgi:hypothetical protein
MVKRILVFPCGSEIGLEIFRSLRYSAHFELVGASSVEDHGRIVFEEYIGGVPYHNEPGFGQYMAELVVEHRIDAIYPAMDSVAESLKKLEEVLGAIVIGSSLKATSICASKRLTYELLKNNISVPKIYGNLDDAQFPIFIKPDKGYGSRNTLLANNEEDARAQLNKCSEEEMLCVEFLPGKEWTIDCFSDRHGNLLFYAPRIRGRISNGISVYTKPCYEFLEEFSQWAASINSRLRPRGAWFFQAKLDSNNEPKLLEVAARLGGSSALFRCLGVNFALLAVFDAFDRDVSISVNNYSVEMDRALDNKYTLDLTFKKVYVDLDDCLIIRGSLNLSLLKFLFKALSEEKEIILLTRHYQNPLTTLKNYRISEIFDLIIHLEDPLEKKSQYIDCLDSIFIDDSYVERSDVASTCGISVFSPDMIEALL